MDKIQREVEHDIKKFLDTGKLPKDYDVRQIGHEALRGSPYWDWVGSNGGLEPKGNADDLTDDKKEGASSKKSEQFKTWLLLDYPKLSEDIQELFTLAFDKGVGQEALATYFGVSQRTIRHRLLKLKRRIARWTGIKDV